MIASGPQIRARMAATAIGNAKTGSRIVIPSNNGIAIRVDLPFGWSLCLTMKNSSIAKNHPHGAAFHQPVGFIPIIIAAVTSGSATENMPRQQTMYSPIEPTRTAIIDFPKSIDCFQCPFHGSIVARKAPITVAHTIGLEYGSPSITLALEPLWGGGGASDRAGFLREDRLLDCCHIYLG